MLGSTSGQTKTIASLAGGITGILQMPGPYTLTVGDARNLSSIYAGELAGGGGSLIKAGTSTLTLSGANSYGGNTFINAGTLVAANASALGGSAVTVAPGANLTVAGVALNTGLGSISLNGGNALTGIGSAAVLGGVTLATADSTITVDGTDFLTLFGKVDGGFGMVKAGTGTLTLSGIVANTYSGDTTISAGIAC